jgi:fatty acid desaturase
MLGELVAGYFTANVLLGNHEREKRHHGKIQVSFIDHQLLSARNYREDNTIWLILMGGMQFHAEHHLFPQIPFYMLPTASPIIKRELSKINRSINYGPIL